MTARKGQRRPKIVRGQAPFSAPPGMMRVTVNTVGDNYVSVDAWVFGEWAAHRRIGGGTSWDVTFLPSGLNITGEPKDRSAQDRKFTEDQAKRVADWLNCHVAREEMYDWSKPSAEVVDRIYQGLEMVTLDLAAWADSAGLS